MDRLDAMRVFTRVAERRSFTAAASDLGLPRSTVTEAVKQLEARLGVPLLARTTRRVGLTAEGAAYLTRCHRILADVEEAESAFSGTVPAGKLRVEAHGTLARNFLMPRLPGFLARHPGITLTLSEGDRYVDPIREGVDCVIRVGPLADSDMTARQLTLLPEVTLATPAYLARHGTPAHPEDLLDPAAGHRMVGFHSSATGGLLPLEFRDAAGPREITLPATLTVMAAESYFAAACAGLGLVQVPRYRAERHLRDGTLVEVLPAMPPAPSPVSALWPRAAQRAPRLRIFLDWLTEVFQEGPATEAFPAETSR